LNNLSAQTWAFFPLFFIALWLSITTILAMLSGWFQLAARFPNQEQGIEPLLRLRWRSGKMGFGVHMRGILRLSAFSSGLSVGITRMFGPFCRDFFVPWENITVTRRTILFWRFAKLQLGDPAIGTLTISTRDADRLARAASPNWPETGPFEKETRSRRLYELLAEWALLTSAAALFFTLVPLILPPSTARPPVLVGVLFPAIFFGVVTTVRYFVDGLKPA
jgi:hypothetical protein